MKKFKFLSVLLAMLLLFTMTACGDSEDEPKDAEIELWSAPNSVKILQDIHTYDDIKSSANITIDTAKNEYESAQIILTANVGSADYTVEISDLKQEGGEAVFDKKNVEVFNMKYTYVSSPWNSDSSIGWYPDAILPMETAVEYGENKVEEGNNQSVYFSFYTSKDQPVGLYKGSFKITVDGKENIIPVSINVRDITISEDMHHESMVINGWTFYIGEYDSTQAMFEKYVEMLLEYRLAPTSFVYETTWGEEDARLYAEKAYEFGSRKDCSNITIPVSKGEQGIKTGQLTRYILALAEKSFETKFDLLSKCCVYGVDEPMSNNAFEKTKKYAETFEAQRTDAIDALESKKDQYLNDYELSENFFDELIQSIKDIHYITTTRYSEGYDPYIDVWCPTFQDYETGIATGVYENQEEVWWYGALGPKKPYPTYHICDVLVSSRMIGWLQAIYGIKGNIYWGLDVYASLVNSNYVYPEEFYEDASHYLNVNGDGFLVYPGKKYNIDGPIASIRLESIRDGYEEYELIYDIKEKYKAKSQEIGVEFSADSTIEDIASSLYTGTQVTANSKTFAQAREHILNLSEFTQSGACFTDYSDDGEGKIEYKLYIPNGVSIQVSGITEKDSVNVAGGKITTYQADMSNANVSDVAVFKTAVNGKEVAVERYLPGKISRFTAEELSASFVSGTVEEETVVVDASSVVSGLDGKMLKITLPASSADTKQEVKFENVNLTSKLGVDVSKLVFNIYSESDEEIPIEVFVKFKNKVYPVSIMSSAFMIKKGMNKVEWKNVSGVDWAKNGEVERILFSIGEKNSPKRSNLYLKSAIIYSQREDK